MNIANKGTLGPLLTGQPEEEHNDNTKRKAEERDGVSAANTPETLGTNSTPKNGGGEEGVDTGAEEAEGSIGGADVLQVDLELDNTNVDKGGDETGNHLREEGKARGNLYVVSQLQVVAEG